MEKYRKYLLTGSIVLVALIVVLVKYWDYLDNPWTRNGQVRAEVIQLTARVSGPIVSLPIKDNQFVKAGDVLFEIDPRTFQANLDRAKAQLDETGEGVEAMIQDVDASVAQVEMTRTNVQQAESAVKELDSKIASNLAEYERQMILLPKGSTSQKAVDNAKTTYEVTVEQKKSAMASLAQARASVRQSQAASAKAQASLGELGVNNTKIRAAIAELKQAELNLEFTKVKAPVDGYITNLNLRLGSQANAGQPVLALVDVNSYWIDGFFKENTIGNIQAGNEAVVTLMSYTGTPVKGEVESIGWGISQQDGSTGFELLPNVNPTFEWIRLAQRVPVRIHLLDVPADIKLRVGTTCSVLVKTGSGSNSK
jgi:multidrug resistance efflux pump